MTTPENADDSTHVLEPLTKALKELRNDADRAQLHAPRSPYAMGQRDALDKALHNITQALRTITKALKDEYSKKNNDHDNDT